MLVIILQSKTKKLCKQHRSFNQFGKITGEPSVKDETILSMAYFDSEAVIKQQDIVSFKIPAIAPAKFAFKCLI